MAGRGGGRGGGRRRRGGAAKAARWRAGESAGGAQAPPRGPATAGNRIIETSERRAAEVDRIAEIERAELEESLRRLARTLHGALTHRRRIAAAGRVDPGRTMRRNMRFDGVPFVPVTVRRAEDRPRLVVLADVSLSVRATARFTLHLVHGLQDLFTQVRSFAFVARIAETTELFRDHPAERALGLIFGGDVLDVDANSDYGTVFGEFIAEHASAVTRRTTVLVLGDAQQWQRSEPPRFRRDRPQGARDDLADTGAEVLLVPRQLRPARLRGVLRPGTGRARPGRAGTGGTRAGGRGGGQLSSPHRARWPGSFSGRAGPHRPRAVPARSGGMRRPHRR